MSALGPVRDEFAAMGLSNNGPAHAYDSAARKERRMTNQHQGPASYFPAIEKKYGRPIEEWEKLIRFV